MQTTTIVSVSYYTKNNNSSTGKIVKTKYMSQMVKYSYQNLRVCMTTS